MGILDKVSDALGVVVLGGTLYVFAKYGKSAGESIQSLGAGIQSGVSSVLSPTIMPTVGLGVPQVTSGAMSLFEFLSRLRGDYRGAGGSSGTRPEDRNGGDGERNGNGAGGSSGTRPDDRDSGRNGKNGGGGRNGKGSSGTRPDDRNRQRRRTRILQRYEVR
jgi:hypothetical protein